jgi:hypothetical protein
MPKESRECRGKKKEKKRPPTHTHKTELYSCMMNKDNILQGVYTYYRPSFLIYQKKLSHKKPELEGGRKKVFVLLTSFLSFPLLSFLLVSSSSSSSSFSSRLQSFFLGEPAREGYERDWQREAWDWFLLIEKQAGTAAAAGSSSSSCCCCC